MSFTRPFRTLYFTMATYTLVIVGALLHLLAMHAFIVESLPLPKAKAAIGVDELRTYLTTLGYLTYGSDGLKDSNLESALVMFQKTNHLNVTGKLNPETIDLINTPRCRVPDDNLIHGHQSQSHGVEMGSYNALFQLGNTKWPPTKYNLTYNIIAGAKIQVGEVFELLDACVQAFKLWSDVSEFTFKQVEPSEAQPDLKISFQRGDHGDGTPFDGRGGYLAHAFFPEGGTMHVDADEDWTLGPPSAGQEDLGLVAAHEIGHLLGLAHSENVDAVMYAYARPWNPRVLHSDDIAAIRAMYP